MPQDDERETDPDVPSSYKWTALPMLEKASDSNWKEET
jgi:hypothetical protein